jgi:hypothetical protein
MLKGFDRETTPAATMRRMDTTRTSRNQKGISNIEC